MVRRFTGRRINNTRSHIPAPSKTTLERIHFVKERSTRTCGSIYYTQCGSPLYAQKCLVLGKTATSGRVTSKKGHETHTRRTCRKATVAKIYDLLREMNPGISIHSPPEPTPKALKLPFPCPRKSTLKYVATSDTIVECIRMLVCSKISNIFQAFFVNCIMKISIFLFAEYR